MNPVILIEQSRTETRNALPVCLLCPIPTPLTQLGSSSYMKQFVQLSFPYRTHSIKTVYTQRLHNHLNVDTVIKAT